MDATTKYDSNESPAGNGALAPSDASNGARDGEIIVFHSSATALQDAAVAAAVYRRAVTQQQGVLSSCNA